MMAELEVIDRLYINIPDSVTIHGVTAEPRPYSYDTDDVEFLEYVCPDEADDIEYAIRVYTMLEQGKVFINALVDDEIVKWDYADPQSEQPTEIVKRFEKEFNETSWIVE